MKYNKWTVGLAAVGVISLASAAKAEEKASGNAVMSALSSTTLSGYVDTSAQWNIGTGNENAPRYKFGGPDKADGFNLNVVQVRLEQPVSLEKSDWAAGYRVDLWAGPDANSLGTQSSLSSSDFALRQAYVNLRVPAYNDLFIKMGVFDTIIGYESVESPSNPNFTRSYGHSIEPQTHTGALASYRFTELISASAGVADTVNSTINSRSTSGGTGITSGVMAPLWNKGFAALGSALGISSSAAKSQFVGSYAQAESYKAYMGSVALTAPDSMGWLAGSTLYGGVVNGFSNSEGGSGMGDNQTSYYLGTTIATPVKDLRFGAAFDYLNPRSMRTTLTDSAGNPRAFYADLYQVMSLAGYVSFQATEKLSLHGRVEYFDGTIDTSLDNAAANRYKEHILAVTGTVQYDLWKNVISRVEVRWDHSLSGDPLFGSNDSFGNATAINSWIIAGNLIYKF